MPTTPPARSFKTWGWKVLRALLGLYVTLCVVLFFMHLYWDKPIIGIVFVTSLLLVALFIGLSMTDVDQVGPQRIPDYAPAVQQSTGS